MAEFHNILKPMLDEGLDFKTSLLATLIYAINLQLPLDNCSTDVVREQAKHLLWQYSDDEFNAAWELYSCIYEYECRQSLQGLGGCVATSYADLLTNKPTSSNI
jgi:hypothetical protein